MYGTNNEIALLAQEGIGFPVEPVTGMRADVAVSEDVCTPTDDKTFAQPVAFVLETTCIHVIEFCKGTDINSIIRITHDVVAGVPCRSRSSCRMT